MRKFVFGTILLALILTTASAEDIDGSFIYDGKTRTYLLHLPPSYNEENPFPLVINLHWGGGSPEGQAAFSAMNPKADSEGFLVAYPEGTLSPYGWLGWNSGECLGIDVDDVSFISILIDTLIANYRIDTFRIFVTGFCNGGMMTQRLACELSERIAAVASVAGGLHINNWDDCQPARLIPLMHFHARNDPSVPYYGGWYYDCRWPPVDSFMQHWAEKLVCNLGPDTFYNDSGALRQRWYRADDSCEVILWTTEDGSHYWPGTPLGTKKISANDEMWEFFVAHPLPVEEPGVEEKPMPPSYILDHSLPNPLSKSAKIHFSLGSREHVRLEVFDALGRKVVTLVDGVLDAGQHEVVIDAGRLSTGVYFYRLSTPTFTKTRSVRLIK